MVGPIRWIWACLDTPSPDAARSWAYWAQVTGTTLSTPRGDHGEFVTFVPPRGAAWLKGQAVGSEGGTHLDLDVDDPAAAAREAVRAGATVVAERGYVALRSPGGYPFCFTPVRPGRDPAEPEDEPEARAEVLDQVCLDLPAAVADQEIAFWARLTGWEWSATSPPEFGYLRRPDGMPVRILTQRLGESDGPVRGHVDFACASRTVSLTRHLAAGASVESDHAFWTVLRDPLGRRYCLTDRQPRRATAPRLG